MLFVMILTSNSCCRVLNDMLLTCCYVAFILPVVNFFLSLALACSSHVQNRNSNIDFRYYMYVCEMQLIIDAQKRLGLLLA